MSKKPRTAECKTCGTGITAAAKTGFCRPCFAKQAWHTPGFRDKHAAGIQNKIKNDPAYHAGMKSRGRVFGLKMAADPEVQAKRRESSKKCGALLMRPEMRERTLQAVREKSGATLSRNARAWCPEGYWDLYSFLRRSKKLSGAEARKVVLDTANKDAAKRVAKLSPFERQMQALENGGTLIEMGARATLDRPGVFRRG